ncbi:MAG: thiamine-phosphate kinase [Candidatus Omnitrophota bacterium]
MKKLNQIGEFGFIAEIEKIFNRICHKKNVIHGIGDDAAVIRHSKKEYLLYTTDMLIEGVHFLRTQDPEAIGHKALACSISDIAAMGGEPDFALVSLAFPKNLNYRFANKLCQGLGKTAKKYKISIIGGDTNSFDKIIICVFLRGMVNKKKLVLRSKAKKNDLIFVTGDLGASCRGRHLKFTPRLKESQFLVNNFKINAMIDISDGLIADLNHILKASKAGAVLKEASIPLSYLADSREDAFYTGEDFELLFTLPKKYAGKLLSSWPFKNKVKLSCIGEITAQSQGLKLKTKNNRLKKIKLGGYRHF